MIWRLWRHQLLQVRASGSTFDANNAAKQGSHDWLHNLEHNLHPNYALGQYSIPSTYLSILLNTPPSTPTHSIVPLQSWRPLSFPFSPHAFPSQGPNHHSQGHRTPRWASNPQRRPRRQLRTRTEIFHLIPLHPNSKSLPNPPLTTSSHVPLRPQQLMVRILNPFPTEIPPSVYLTPKALSFHPQQVRGPTARHIHQRERFLLLISLRMRLDQQLPPLHHSLPPNHPQFHLIFLSHKPSSLTPLHSLQVP